MRIIFIIIGILILLFILYEAYYYMKLDREIEAKISKGAIILDVRTEWEYKKGHIQGSKNISLGTIRERYIELDTSKIYITCCSHGIRSAKVKEILREKGFKYVYNGGSWDAIKKELNKQNR